MTKTNCSTTYCAARGVVVWRITEYTPSGKVFSHAIAIPVTVRRGNHSLD